MNNELLQPLMPRSQYIAIHRWLYRHYGKANKCERPDCYLTPKRFHWAKIQALPYEKKRENFKMLCASCHRVYDMTDEERRRIGDNVRGKHLTEEHKRKISAANTGNSNLGGKHRSKPVLQLDLEGNVIAEHPSLTIAALSIDTSMSNLWYCITGRYKLAKGYIWRYA